MEAPLDPSSSTPQDLCILPEQLQLNAMSLNDSKWDDTDSGKDLHILHSTPNNPSGTGENDIVLHRLFGPNWVNYWELGRCASNDGNDGNPAFV